MQSLLSVHGLVVNHHLLIFVIIYLCNFNIIFVDHYQVVYVTPPRYNESVIGPLLYCNLEVEGVPVVSMIDCGSQTTIISHSFLHQVANE